MRDKRFVAAHRGGPLTLAHHRLLALWAADCAEHVLPLFNRRTDRRPHRAIATARAWAKGQIPVGHAQKAAHAAARAATTKPAHAAARAAGHAAATAHMADHSLGACHYAQKAIAAAGASVEAERAWQLRRLTPKLRPLVRSAVQRRFSPRSKSKSSLAL